MCVCVCMRAKCLLVNECVSGVRARVLMRVYVCVGECGCLGREGGGGGDARKERPHPHQPTHTRTVTLAGATVGISKGSMFTLLFSVAVTSTCPPMKNLMLPSASRSAAVCVRVCVCVCVHVGSRRVGGWKHGVGASGETRTKNRISMFTLLF